MARPKQTIVRGEVIRVRFTSTERRILKSYAERYGITVSSFIRAKALDHTLNARLNPEEIIFLRALIGMANNINTITRKVHIGDHYQMELSEVLSEINTQIKKLR